MEFTPTVTTHGLGLQLVICFKHSVTKSVVFYFKYTVFIPLAHPNAVPTKQQFLPVFDKANIDASMRVWEVWEEGDGGGEEAAT